MIKVGIRNNMAYPFMYMLLIIIQRVVRILLEIFIQNDIFIILTLINFFSDFFFGVLISYLQKETNKSKSQKKILGINLIQNKGKNGPKLMDNYFKIFILIFFGCYFSFISSLLSKLFDALITDKSMLQNIKMRGLEIIFSTLLCYFTIRIKIYKHHKLSLFVIIICLITITGLEIILFHNKYDSFELKIYYLILIFVSITYPLFDTIEKYLFEVDFINPFTLLIIEGPIEISLMLTTFLFDLPWNEITTIKNILIENNIYTYLSLFLLLLYFIISGFKNIYGMYTIKLYSPMVRALADFIKDPFLLIYHLFLNDNENIRLGSFFFWINFLISLIVIFFSFVFNEFLILYFCHLEYETYPEIRNRGLILEDISELIENKDDNIKLEEKKELNTYL